MTRRQRTRAFILTAILVLTAATLEHRRDRPDEPLERAVTVSRVSEGRTPAPSATPQATAALVKAQKPKATPAPKEKAAPAAKVSGGVPAIIAANWPEPSSLGAALRVSRCESVRYRPDVVFGPRTGRAGERGAFQIHPGHFDGRWGEVWLPAAAGVTWADMFDPAANTRAAWHLFKRSGWGPWTCKP